MKMASPFSNGMKMVSPFSNGMKPTGVSLSSSGMKLQMCRFQAAEAPR
jgi:hypothetical protein